MEDIIIGTGSEVEIAIKVFENLFEKGKNIRVVSMTCMELFEEQEDAYKEEILPNRIKKFVIEFGSSQSWYKYVKNKDYMITIDEFGLSGSKEDIYNIKKMDIKSITDKIERILGENI